MRGRPARRLTVVRCKRLPMNRDQGDHGLAPLLCPCPGARSWKVFSTSWVLSFIWP